MSVLKVTTNKMRPIHPGEILQDELNAIDLSANAFASKLSVPTNRITAILNGQRGITPETAIRLARFFSTSPEFWLNLQRDFDLKSTQKIIGKKIEHDIQPYDEVA
ncbi:MAG: addiction module antidote protein, HigA family [Gammaproteobacteria bacterium RIFCSPHIGHO2_02_FULL_39_13]|nr:MAG: addiction module antidote protein, HigA family [Gammaproteobacteria bacterium RIFCSPHIGHO2_02_FULL_39_13]OGT50514.1 MAG: addiction module antidote protein, HigA family [Gammaproteobacteria bacterium RIFCSPHIGHO2_12_FULL_39_24]